MYALAVLLVDDNHINRRLGSLMLQRLGCAVTCAADGAAAIEHATTGAYDLVLMDLRMPGVDGLETTRRMRAAGAAMPILALTASATSGDREACAEAGVDELLVKPLRLAQLREVVAQVTAMR